MSPGTPLDRIIAPIARHINLGVWLEQAMGPVIAVLGAFATGLLLLKLLWPEQAQWSAILLVFLPASLAFAHWRSRTGGLFFRTAEVAEVIDHICSDDGSVSTCYERPELIDGQDFLRRVAETLERRRPALNPRHYLRRLGPALLYVLAVALIPPRQSQGIEQTREMMVSLTEPLAEKLETLAPLMSEEQVDQLRENLKQLQMEEQEISRRQWEAVEELEQRIDRAAQATSFDLAAAATTLQRMIQTQSSIQSSASASDPAMQALMQQLNASLNDPSKMLSTQVRGDLSRMAGELREGNFDKEALERRLAQLCERMGQCTGGTCMGEGQMQGAGPDGDGNPGSGGINRGRGDAPLAYGVENLLDGAQFEQRELRNQYLRGEDLVDLGITPLAPKPDPGRFSPGTALGFVDLQGPAISRTRISPSQRKVVEQYFSETQ